MYLCVEAGGHGKASKGNYRRNIHGEVQETQGRIDDSGVVYGPWLEGVGSRNATTRFKGYSSFRRTAQKMEELAPEIATRHVQQAVQELS